MTAHEEVKGILPLHPGHTAGATCTCGWHSHSTSFAEHLRETLTEEEIQKAYMEIALEESLTVQTVADDFSRAIVPAHWRNAAVERALDNREKGD